MVFFAYFIMNSQRANMGITILCIDRNSNNNSVNNTINSALDNKTDLVLSNNNDYVRKL